MIARPRWLCVVWLVALVVSPHIAPCLCSLLSIDAVTLLLPPSDGAYSVSYPLSAHGGCFTWHTSHPALIQLTPQSQCVGGHTSVTVRPLITSTALSERRGVWVWAIDVASSARVECEVFLDAIDAIQILTTTRRVNVNDVETLELIAFDSSANAFSSVVGLPAQWAIQQSGVLAAITLALSNIDAPAALYALERSGLTSSILPVKGVHPGKVTVAATMYGRITAAVDITVTEPLILHPNFARIMPASQLTLQLMTRQRQLPTHDDVNADDAHSARAVLAMPNTQYVWRTTNNATVSLDESGRIVARAVGSARISVTDVNIAEHRKEADVHVVEPTALIAKLIYSDVDNARAYTAESLPTCDGAYTVASGNALRLMIALTDSADRHIDIAPNVHFTVATDGDSLKTSPLPPRAHAVVNAVFADINSTKTLGTTALRLTLDDVVAPLTGATYSPPPLLRAELRVNVVRPIIVASSAAHFPLIGSSLLVPLNATGGSGEYVWRSRNTQTATVEQNRVHFIRSGDATIDVVDKCDPRNSANVVLTAAEPSNLQLIESTIEGQVGSDIQLFIKLSDANGDAFDDCTALTMQTHIEHGRAHTIRDANVHCHTRCPVQTEANCFQVRLSCRHEGFTSLRLEIRESATPPLVVTVSAFLPLNVEPASLSLSVGHSGFVSYSGGVVAWPAADRSRRTSESDVVVGAVSYSVSDWSDWADLERRTPSAFNETYSLPIDVFDSADDIIEARLSSRGVIQVTCQQIAADDVALDIRTHNAHNAQRHVATVTRSTVHIRCLSPLTFSKVSLAVGAVERLVARSEDGAVHPLHDQVTYSTRDSAVLLVDSDGAVEAIGLGTGHVTATISNASAIGFSADIEVAVRFETFVIVAGSDVLIAGQTVWLHVEGARGEKPGDTSFSRVHCEWTTSDGGVSLLPAISSARTAANVSVVGYSVRVVAQRPGTWNVTAHIAVDVPDSATPTRITESINIRVVEPLRLLSPAHLILTPNARAAIVTTHDDHQQNVRFVVVDAECASDGVPLVSVDSHGVIRAHHAARNADDTIIVVRSLAQSVVVHVSIRPIHHLSIVSASDIDAPLCPSNNVTLSVQAKDSLGRIFDGVDIAGDTLSNDEVVTYRVSRPDLIRVHRSPIVTTQSAYNGVIAQFVCSAVASSEILQSAVIRLAIVNQTTVPPLFIHMFVSATKCIQPQNDALVAFKVAPQMIASVMNNAAERSNFIFALIDAVAAATGVSAGRFQVVSVDPSSGDCEVVIKSQPPTPHRTPLQWFLTDDREAPSIRVAEILRSKLSETPPPFLLRMIDTATGLTRVTSYNQRNTSESVWTDERHSDIEHTTPRQSAAAQLSHAGDATGSATILSPRSSVLSRALAYAIPLLILALPILYYYFVVAPSMSASAPHSLLQWLSALIVPRPPLMDPTRTAAPIGNVVDATNVGMRRRMQGQPRFHVDVANGNVNGFIAKRAHDADAINISR